MIGKRIQQLRKDNGLTLTQLAERAGIAKSYLSSIERDIQKNPSIHFLEKIADVLNIDVKELLNDEEPKENKTTLDKEWIDLALEAMESGISKEQFREFLEFNKWRLQKPKQ
ncbi:helix-turn-helix domain-containing protein [Aneurinibacillus sp. Ricciae_BoGa-3]|uniref:helix-turn-helix domain-containing protein n=1 Tax=Aneurinibacillus sp. Ricciae_BoGa-3 TaxID=3022697 RepID=UPI00234140EC|nr:helix-turn-helix domain-containing protein [Aneurinibacillus sp. Ricciae_BoGa-3]WCK54268.1 helix-turn-helix domain-containing protein [Aneurinibacillus sp. Ricciae_BoGa-3]